MTSFPMLIPQLIPDEYTRLALSSHQMGMNVVIEDSWGRISNNIQIPYGPNYESTNTRPIIPNLYELIKECSESYFGLSAVPSYWKWAKYSPLFGIPNVPPHIDLNACTFTIDLQLDSNIEWEIFVEGIPYIMRNGDALLYLGNEQMHWRPKFPTKSIKHYVEMCFIHFVEPNHAYHTLGERFHYDPNVKQEWINKMNYLLPKYKCDSYCSFVGGSEFPGY